MCLPHTGDTAEGAGRAGLTEEFPRELNLESRKSLRARNLWEQLGSLAFGGVCARLFPTGQSIVCRGGWPEGAIHHHAANVCPVLSQAPELGSGVQP